MKQDDRYAYVDAAIKTANQKIARAFGNLKSIPLDDLNAIDRAYRDIVFACEEVILRTARHYYNKSDESGEKTAINAKWLDAVLLSVLNPITHYKYKSEIDRKKAYLKEGIRTGAEQNSRRIANESVDTSMRHFSRMIAQYILDAADTATLTAYRDSGVTHVKWNSVHDKRRCGDCGILDGKVFPITSAPPKQHWNCRCYYTPVK